MYQSSKKQQKQQKLNDEGVLCAKYLWNMLNSSNEDIDFYEDIPKTHESDYWSDDNGYNKPEINNITANDIVFGNNSNSNLPDEEKIEGEEITCRGKDNFFGYTTQYPREVIAIAKIYRFKDLNLPDSSEINCPRKNDRVLGMYASDLKEYDSIDIEVDIEYDDDDWDKEISFYEIFFNSVNLGYIYDKAFYEYDNYGCKNISLFDKRRHLCDFSITDDLQSLVSINQVRDDNVW